VQVKDGPRTDVPCGGERPPAKQGMEVVGVEDIRPEPPDRVAHLLWMEAARH
jgi:hypothetical protein